MAGTTPDERAVTLRNQTVDALKEAGTIVSARIGPGMNVLEIGSGGMNAAYLSELVGPTGRVTTVDIDEFVTDRTSRFLDQAGYSRVDVVLADAEYGVRNTRPTTASWSPSGRGTCRWSGSTNWWTVASSWFR